MILKLISFYAWKVVFFFEWPYLVQNIHMPVKVLNIKHECIYKVLEYRDNYKPSYVAKQIALTRLYIQGYT